MIFTDSFRWTFILFEQISHFLVYLLPCSYLQNLVIYFLEVGILLYEKLIYSLSCRVFQMVHFSLFITWNIILKMRNILGVIFQSCQIFFLYGPLSNKYMIFAKNATQNSTVCITWELTLSYGSDHPLATNSYFFQDIPLKCLEAKTFYPCIAKILQELAQSWSNVQCNFVGASLRAGLEFAKWILMFVVACYWVQFSPNVRLITVIYIDGEDHLLPILPHLFRCWEQDGLRTGLTISESLTLSIFASSLQVAGKSNSDGCQTLPPLSGTSYFSYPDAANTLSFLDRLVVGKQLSYVLLVN